MSEITFTQYSHEELKALILEAVKTAITTLSASEATALGAGGSVRKYLFVDEAANYLGINKRTLSGMTTKGDMPHRKLGNKNIYLIKDLDDYILKQTPEVGIAEKAAEYIREMKRQRALKMRKK